MKIKVLSTAIVLCLASSQAQAYDFLSGGVAYNVLSNTNTRKTAAVTYVTNEADASGYVTTYRGDLVIPAQVTDRSFNTYNVIQIGDRAMFNNQSLYTLELPEGISSIGSQAFSHCYSMYKINIPSTVSRIADYAFEFCEDLTSISLPARLSDMGSGVFQECYGLESIEVDPACLDYKSIDGVLYSGVTSPFGMTLLAYPGARPDDEYVMPDGVSSIDSYALSANWSMRSITLSKDLKNFDTFTFLDCVALEEINVAEGNTNLSATDGVLFSADGSKLICYPAMRYAQTYEVPEGVKSLDGFAFFQASGISSLTLPSTLTTVGELCFFASVGYLEVTSKATVPPKWSASGMLPNESLFDEAVYTQATLYVPDEAVDAYKSAPGWKNFSTIAPLSSSVEDMTAEPSEAPAEYFNLQGQRVSRPASGSIMLIRRGGKVTKEVVR